MREFTTLPVQCLDSSSSNNFLTQKERKEEPREESVCIPEALFHRKGCCFSSFTFRVKQVSGVRLPFFVRLVSTWLSLWKTYERMNKTLMNKAAITGQPMTPNRMPTCMFEYVFTPFSAVPSLNKCLKFVVLPSECFFTCLKTLQT